MRSFRERKRRLIALLLVAFVGGILFLSYFCPQSLCSDATSSPSPRALRPRNAHAADEDHLPAASAAAALFSDDDVARTFIVDSSRDVLVFLHAQKTGGSTFGRHLVRDAGGGGVPTACVCRRRRKRCDCGDAGGRQWLFSRYSSGWACGLHADWTELHDCVPNYLDRREGQRRQRRFALHCSLHVL